MNSEMVGVPTSMPWGFVFTKIDDVPRHPAQLYEAIYCFVLFLVLFRIWFNKGEDLRDGFLSALFLIILFSLRFVDEFLKINQVSFEDDLVLNMGQILSIPFVIIGIVILFLTRRKVSDDGDFEETMDNASR
jgi:prolipoprotein diacylglyceryltransferase